MKYLVKQNFKFSGKTYQIGMAWQCDDLNLVAILSKKGLIEDAPDTCQTGGESDSPPVLEEDPPEEELGEIMPSQDDPKPKKKKKKG